jgi:hypothetical protein
MSGHKQKNKQIEFRCTEYEYNFIRLRAGQYSGGNVSKFIRECVLEFKPKRRPLSEPKGLKER